MSADNAQREPTMEEILSSIRKIISEEDEPAGALDLQAEGEPVADVSEPEPAPVVEREPEPVAEVEPEPVEAEFSETPDEDDNDLVFMDPEADAPAPEAVLKPEPEARDEPLSDVGLVADAQAHLAAGALGKLMGSMQVNSSESLNGIVRELLKPMLKEWLDSHLPQVVEAEVEKEIERIRRMAR